MTPKVMPVSYAPAPTKRYAAIAAKVSKGQVVKVTVLCEDSATSEKTPVAQHITPDEAARLLRILPMRDAAPLN